MAGQGRGNDSHFSILRTHSSTGHELDEGAVTGRHLLAMGSDAILMYVCYVHHGQDDRIRGSTEVARGGPLIALQAMLGWN